MKGNYFISYACHIYPEALLNLNAAKLSVITYRVVVLDSEQCGTCDRYHSYLSSIQPHGAFLRGEYSLCERA